jgi:hypothetical protein
LRARRAEGVQLLQQEIAQDLGGLVTVLSNDSPQTFHAKQIELDIFLLCDAIRKEQQRRSTFQVKRLLIQSRNRQDTQGLACVRFRLDAIAFSRDP